MQIQHSRNNGRRAQRGAAMIIMMLIIVLGLVGLFTYRLDRKGAEQKADRQTALALAQAKEALLGYAAKDDNRPGSLPCADIDNDGAATVGVDLSCGPNKIGRLPWKLLDMDDVRDGDTERLWYALSPDFRSQLLSPLNSAKLGQITLRNTQGIVTDNAAATPSTGVVAVIIAPGVPIQRQDSLVQNRNCVGGGGCTSSESCLAPILGVPKCNPINYLDIYVGTEDNSNFIASTGDGFISGIVFGTDGTKIVNDKILTITTKELFSVATFRIVKELANNWKNKGYFPGVASTPPLANTPAVWADNDWDIAIKTFAATLATATIQFVNCNAIYEIDNKYNVTRKGIC